MIANVDFLFRTYDILKLGDDVKLDLSFWSYCGEQHFGKRNWNLRARYDHNITWLGRNWGDKIYGIEGGRIFTEEETDKYIRITNRWMLFYDSNAFHKCHDLDDLEEATELYENLFMDLFDIKVDTKKLHEDIEKMREFTLNNKHRRDCVAVTTYKMVDLYYGHPVIP